MQTQTPDTQRQPSARYASVELKRLHTDLQRMVQDLRMKTKSASAESQHLLEALDDEVKRFGGEVAAATRDARDDLRKAGTDLHMRIQKLANQVALPS